MTNPMEIPTVRSRHFWLSVLIVFAAALASCGHDVALAYFVLH